MVSPGCPASGFLAERGGVAVEAPAPRAKCPPHWPRIRRPPIRPTPWLAAWKAGCCCALVDPRRRDCARRQGPPIERRQVAGQVRALDRAGKVAVHAGPGKRHQRALRGPFCPSVSCCTARDTPRSSFGLPVKVWGVCADNSDCRDIFAEKATQSGGVMSRRAAAVFFILGNHLP